MVTSILAKELCHKGPCNPTDTISNFILHIEISVVIEGLEAWLCIAMGDACMHDGNEILRQTRIITPISKLSINYKIEKIMKLTCFSF